MSSVPTVHRELAISNESKNLSMVRTAVSEVLDMSPFDPTMRNKIIVAVDEALANVVEHAYQGGEGEINILFDLDPSQLQVTIRDNGVKFSPGERLSTEINIHEHIRQGLKGGLGMFLMRQIMDEVRFGDNSGACVNELVLVKKLPPPEIDDDAGSGEG